MEVAVEMAVEMVGVMVVAAALVMVVAGVV